MFDLDRLGWGPDLRRSFDRYVAASGDDGRQLALRPGRVACAHGDRCDLLTADGAAVASLAGRLREAAQAERPVAGDWVALRCEPGGGDGRIVAVLPRRTRLARQAPGRRAAAQVLAANVDVVLVVTACGHDRNARRVERYAAVAWESGATPVVVLNKIDLDPAWPALSATLESVAAGAPVVPLSAHDDDVAAALAPWLGRGRTVALLGPSGVGKSTLVNRIAGRELQATGAVRAGDRKGRHTTTRRELIVLPGEPAGGRGLLLDTPGLRELQPWGDADDATAAFDDVAALAADCRFRDCTHRHEPGCAVRAAVEDGALAADRHAAHDRLVREAEDAARRRSATARADERRRGRVFARVVRDVERWSPKRR